MNDKHREQTGTCEIEDKGDAATASVECSTAVTQIMKETDDLYEETNDPGQLRSVRKKVTSPLCGYTWYIGRRPPKPSLAWLLAFVTVIADHG